MSEKTINDIEAIIKVCEKCSLCKTRTNVVAGSGNPCADIMFVGEAPGQYEDLQGKPFVGKSGQLLDKYLSDIGLSRKDIFIANILKCRPPQNRDPEPQEQDLCMPYLRAQYKIIKPKIIVCLGRISAQRLISPNFRITSQHGTFIKKGDCLFTATYHPSAILRFPERDIEARADFEKIRQQINLLKEKG